MAKFELKFFDCVEPSTFIKVYTDNDNGDEKLENKVIKIVGYDECTSEHFSVWLDKSTAIKFAKTLRTEINKITESEVSNE